MILDHPTVLLLVFSSCLGLGGTFAVLRYVRSSSDTVDTLKLKHDKLLRDSPTETLRDRMHQLGTNTWKDLQQSSGLSRRLLRQVRNGDVAQLRLRQLTQLATALSWSTEELLKNLGVVSADLDHQIGQQTADQQTTKPSTMAETSVTEVLRQECLQLRDQLQQQNTELTTDVRDSAFQQLQTLLTNYPSVRQMMQVKPDLPAKNLVSLFTPLDNLLASWRYEPIRPLA